MSEFQLKTPVALIIFNRPDTTERVFAEIAKAKPPKLLVIGDGARVNRAGEAEKVAAARAIITRVDWECEVLTNYSEVNLGCKRRVSSGIDWVFEQVEEAIILEDDCLPHPDFFQFCEMMLGRYLLDTRIMMICGTNYLQNIPTIAESYFFSNYYPIWGWATWRRAWALYRVDMKAWESFDKKKQLHWIFGRKEIAHYYENMFQLIDDDLEFWDIQWWFACIFQHGLAIVPRTNLITNIGVSGTHTQTQGDFFTNMPTYSLDMDNIIHPEYVVPDIDLNRLTYELSHANLDFSVKEALKKGKFRSILRRLLPDRVLQLILRLKKRSLRRSQ